MDTLDEETNIPEQQETPKHIQKDYFDEAFLEYKKIQNGETEDLMEQNEVVMEKADVPDTEEAEVPDNKEAQDTNGGENAEDSSPEDEFFDAVDDK